MQTRCFTHSLDTGWSVDEFPDLDDSNTLVLVFGAPEYLDNPQALIDLGGAFPLAVKLGCSTAGEIFGTSITDRTLAVAVIRFERSRIALAVSSIDIESSLNAGRSLGAQLSGDSLKSVFILCDGLQVNGSALVDGLSETLNQSVAITGGLAGDCSRFEQSWTWQGAEPKGGQALAVGLYGDALECRHGSYGGWSAFGPERLITRATSSTLYELDGQPALDLYKRYLGQYADELPSSGLLFPLAIRHQCGNGEQAVRTILSVDNDQKSITFAGNMPEGAYAQLMTANFEQLIDASSIAARQLSVLPEHDHPGILIGISCVGRRLLLGERAEEELEAVMESMTRPPAFVGFYSYGEISPNQVSTGCSLKNQTMTLTWLGEH